MILWRMFDSTLFLLSLIIHFLRFRLLLLFWLWTCVPFRWLFHSVAVWIQSMWMIWFHPWHPKMSLPTLLYLGRSLGVVSNENANQPDWMVRFFFLCCSGRNAFSQLGSISLCLMSEEAMRSTCIVSADSCIRWHNGDSLSWRKFIHWKCKQIFPNKWYTHGTRLTC